MLMGVISSSTDAEGNVRFVINGCYKKPNFSWVSKWCFVVHDNHQFVLKIIMGLESMPDY